jgi:hypothetical protein
MGFNPNDQQSLSIAKKTKTNLDYIYGVKAGEVADGIKDENSAVNEFTQLLNSLLSMVISLREDFFYGSHVGWDEVRNLGLSSYDSQLELITGDGPSVDSAFLQKISSFSQLEPV